MKPAFFSKALFILITTVFSYSAFSQTTFFSYGTSWKYLDNDTRPSNWQTSGFNDASWSSGPGLLGYEDSDVLTCVKSSAAPATCSPGGVNKYITTYFRKSVTITDPTIFSDFTMNVYRDDGVVIYVNGVEVVADNMPAGRTHGTFASSCASDGGDAINAFTIPKTAFVAGANVIAVELHQCNLTSSDLVFGMELIGNVAPVSLIAYGANWKYLDDGSNQGSAWIGTGFNDVLWKTGASKFGYGDAATTVVFSGCGLPNYPAAENPSPGCTTKYITTYFRKNFTITGLSSYSGFDFNVIRDDGYVIYINGVEVARDNMPGGAITYTTGAVSAIGGSGETTPVNFSISACSGYFVEGTNTIAVEIHQTDGASSDLGFNLELIGNPGGPAGTPTLTRDPYLQVASETGMTFRWRTSTACYGRVRVGLANGTYTTASADETCATTEHIVRITGLTPDTKYFYQISATDGTILQGGVDNFFRTNPPSNTTRKLRFAAFGDCGRGNSTYQDDNLSNYLSYLSTNTIDAPDALLLMGDNAYSSGTEAEYTSKFFGIYGGNILKNHKLFPTPGNHDYGNNSGNKSSRSMPYHSLFSVPQNAEAGGVASNKQNYYSYDVGNVHFLALDSYGIEGDGTDMQTSGTSALKTWLTADLAANTKKWVVAYWHHPPYTKSSHNSDSEGDLVNIRQNFIGFLESRGVDLIINGHSHAYERSYLLRNFTGLWTTFSAPSHAVSTSSATYTSGATCPYVYNSSPANHGTVYVVAGSTGASGGTNSGFGANGLPFAVNDGGMFYFEVEDNRLDAKMLRRNGTIFDRFTIMKDANTTNNYNIVNGASVNLTAAWPQTGNYTWTGSPGSTRTVNVTPPNNATTNYSVTDAFGCVTSQFSVTTTGTLPVSILDYNVRLNNNKVDITWSTATEVNNKYFTIERSSDGANFTAIGNVNGAGNSTSVQNYSFVDNNPLLGTSYYRLSQTDIDDHKEYLRVKQIVNNKGTDFEVKAISSGSGNLSLQINSSDQSVYQLRIFDLNGRERKNEMIHCNAGICQKDFLLGTGVFVYEVVNSKGEKVSQKVLVK